ncbi:MAG: hypothetical protein WCO78_02765 [Candidatus Roizmanbacteria bacterium]
MKGFRTPTDPPENLFTFQFHIFNPLHWLMNYLVKLEKNKDGRISVKIPYLWFLTFLVVIMGGGGVMGAALTGPRTYIEGQIAERMVWIAKPSPTPVIVIPTPAPVLVTRLGVVRATYQVKDLLPTVTPPSPTASEPASLVATPSPTVLRYVLIAENNELIFIHVPATVSLNTYLGSRVLLTGYYDAATKTLSVATLGDVEAVW